MNAVQILKKGKGKSRKLPAVLLDSDEEEEDSDTMATVSKGKKPCTVQRELLHDLEVLTEDVQDMKKDLKSVLTLTPESVVHLGLRRILIDTFRCCICMDAPIKPPVTYMRCGKRTFGCQVCIDTWFSGEAGMSNKCPICRSEQAYVETSIIKGLDDFFTAMSTILSPTAHNVPSETADKNEEEASHAH